MYLETPGCLPGLVNKKRNQSPEFRLFSDAAPSALLHTARLFGLVDNMERYNVGYD
jgi:hypothetical protein